MASGRSQQRRDAHAGSARLTLSEEKSPQISQAASTGRGSGGYCPPHGRQMKPSLSDDSSEEPKKRGACWQCFLRAGHSGALNRDAELGAEATEILQREPIFPIERSGRRASGPSHAGNVF